MEAFKVFPNALSSEECDYIAQQCEHTLNIEDATLGEQAKRDVRTKVRSSQTGFIEAANLGHTDLWNYTSSRLWNFANEANRTSFGFDVSYLSYIQYTIYEPPGDHYDWHIDTFLDTPNAYHRKLSMTVQLSDGWEYEGGDFELRHDGLEKHDTKSKGTILVFPSFLLHRVKPVTKGSRKTLVAWFEGKAFR